MKRLRLLFYFTTIGIALGYFFAVLLSFFVQYAMLADESLVVFVWTVYGIMTGFVFKKIGNKYGFFIIEGLILIMMLIAGRMNILYYITKEVLGLTSIKQVQTPFLISLVLINLINLYIILTRSKYQKVYTKEELKKVKEEFNSDSNQVKDDAIYSSHITKKDKEDYDKIAKTQMKDFKQDDDLLSDIDLSDISDEDWE